MAKRQNFIVGSTNPITVSKTTGQLNNGWDRYQVLKAGDLDGVLNAVSDYSKDSSDEIANAILALTGSQPTGATTNELAGALNQMRQDIETSSLTFIGYISSTQPSASDYTFQEGDIWIQSATLPTSFPVAIAGIWDGTQWASTTNTYTQKDFDFFRNINDSEGYYWFGGEWKIMSTDMSTTYFTLNQTSGKWEIKDSVNLPGSPTVATPTSASPQTQIANKKYVDDAIGGSGTGRNVGDIFFTTRRDNSLNGAVECNGTQYNTTDFSGNQNIGAMLQAGKIPYVSLAVYASTITNQGWCDKFGWDGGTVFKVPTLNAYIWQKISTIIKGSIGTSSASDNGKYFVAQLTSFTQGTAPAAGGYTITVANNQTIPGAYIDATSVVSNQRVMVQLAIAASDEALETCTNVLSDVSALNTHRLIAYQQPTAQNNYTWYRKYADGWVEQGGIQLGSANIPYGSSGNLGTINLPVVMASNDYFATASGNNYCMLGSQTLTSSQAIFYFVSYVVDRTLTDVRWYVCGKAA